MHALYTCTPNLKKSIGSKSTDGDISFRCDSPIECHRHGCHGAVEQGHCEIKFHEATCHVLSYDMTLAWKAINSCNLEVKVDTEITIALS